MEIEIKYAVKIPFMDGQMYLLNGEGGGVMYYPTYEEAKEQSDRWKGKVVQVTFEEVE